MKKSVILIQNGNKRYLTNQTGPFTGADIFNELVIVGYNHNDPDNEVKTEGSETVIRFGENVCRMHNDLYKLFTGHMLSVDIAEKVYPNFESGLRRVNEQYKKNEENPGNVPVWEHIANQYYPGYAGSEIDETDDVEERDEILSYVADEAGFVFNDLVNNCLEGDDDFRVEDIASMYEVFEDYMEDLSYYDYSVDYLNKEEVALSLLVDYAESLLSGKVFWSISK